MNTIHKILVALMFLGALNTVKAQEDTKEEIENFYEKLSLAKQYKHNPVALKKFRIPVNELFNDEDKKILNAQLSDDCKFLMIMTHQKVIVFDTENGNVVYEYSENPNQRFIHIACLRGNNTLLTASIYEAKVHDYINGTILYFEDSIKQDNKRLMLDYKNSVIEDNQLFYEHNKFLQLDVELLGLHISKQNEKPRLFNSRSYDDSAYSNDNLVNNLYDQLFNDYLMSKYLVKQLKSIEPSNDKTIALQILENKIANYLKLETLIQSLINIQLSNDGQVLVTTSEKKVIVRNVNNKKLLYVVNKGGRHGHQLDLKRAFLNNDNTILITESPDKVMIHDIKTQSVLYSINSVDINNDQENIASVELSDDENILRIRLKNGKTNDYTLREEESYANPLDDENIQSNNFSITATSSSNHHNKNEFITISQKNFANEIANSLSLEQIKKAVEAQKKGLEYPKINIIHNKTGVIQVRFKDDDLDLLTNLINTIETRQLNLEEEAQLNAEIEEACTFNAPLKNLIEKKKEQYLLHAKNGKNTEEYESAAEDYIRILKNLTEQIKYSNDFTLAKQIEEAIKVIVIKKKPLEARKIITKDETEETATAKDTQSLRLQEETLQYQKLLQQQTERERLMDEDVRRSTIARQEAEQAKETAKREELLRQEKANANEIEIKRKKQNLLRNLWVKSQNENFDEDGKEKERFDKKEKETANKLLDEILDEEERKPLNKAKLALQKIQQLENQRVSVRYSDIELKENEYKSQLTLALQNAFLKIGNQLVKQQEEIKREKNEIIITAPAPLEATKVANEDKIEQTGTARNKNPFGSLEEIAEKYEELVRKEEEEYKKSIATKITANEEEAAMPAKRQPKNFFSRAIQEATQSTREASRLSNSLEEAGRREKLLQQQLEQRKARQQAIKEEQAIIKTAEETKRHDKFFQQELEQRRAFQKAKETDQTSETLSYTELEKRAAYQQTMIKAAEEKRLAALQKEEQEAIEAAEVAVAEIGKIETKIAEIAKAPKVYEKETPEDIQKLLETLMKEETKERKKARELKENQERIEAARQLKKAEQEAIEPKKRGRK